MRSSRALVAADPRLFGRARAWQQPAPDGARWTAVDDARLFASTFAAGFLFVSILIA